MSTFYRDPITCILYSTDASILEVLPTAVAFPNCVEELDGIIERAREEKMAVTMRGAGTGITGGCLGNGLIVDSARHLNKIIGIDPIGKSAVVEPGVIQDDLNHALSSLGLRLGPDTSTGDRATIGGMIANNAAGSRSLFYGSMRDAVEEIELLLATGETLHFHLLSEEAWREKRKLSGIEGEIYRTLDRVRTEFKEEIEKAFPPLARRSSGYALDTLLSPFPLNVSKLIAGSEGTLGVIKRAKVKLSPLLKRPVLALNSYPTVLEAMQDVMRLLAFKPKALELIDDKIIEAALLSPLFKGKIPFLKEGNQVLLVAEFEEEELPAGQFETVFKSSDEMQMVWNVRKAGLGLLLSKRSYQRAVAFIEDIALPPERLSAFITRFHSYLKACGKEAGIYGHAGPGCLHIRPYIDLRKIQERELMKRMMQDITAMVRAEKGSLSGEHGDGLIRSFLYAELFGKKCVEAFQIVKNAFDPLHLMNPHKIVDPVPFEPFIRKPAENQPKTFFSFKEEGGLALSADLCNGNGACRKKEGLMCPSFQATQNEYDSTRGRANALRALLKGELGKSGLENRELHAILDLCLQCKGCKKECPSQVDMAKMKSEALYHYQKRHGISLRDRLFGSIDALCRFGYPLRKLLNPLLNKSFWKAWAGIAPDIALPRFAEKRFSELFPSILQPEGAPLVLINDTYTEFYEPNIGMSAVKVLNALGYRVLLPKLGCCGRAALSKGMLEEASRKGERLLNSLEPFALKGMPLVGLEPSCFYTLLDEYADLFPRLTTSIRKNLFLFDAFLSQRIPLNLRADRPVHLLLHGHCHQKALEGMEATLKVLRSIENLTVEEIPSGCCGMAGAFGHETEHRDISKKIADLVLIPYLNKASPDAIVIASGFSCRSQISSHDKNALHLAEFLANLLP